MKKLVMIMIVFASAATVSFAQTATPGAEQAVAETQEPVEKKIELAEVPAKVQDALKASEYKDAQVSEVYEVTENDSIIYKFLIDANDAKWTVKFDADGKLIDSQQN